MNRIMKCLSALWIKSGMLYLCLLFVFPLSVRSQSTGMINGHEYVDLGLPSGLKWATCNVLHQLQMIVAWVMPGVRKL